MGSLWRHLFLSRTASTSKTACHREEARRGRERGGRGKKRERYKKDKPPRCPSRGDRLSPSRLLHHQLLHLLLHSNRRRFSYFGPVLVVIRGGRDPRGQRLGLVEEAELPVGGRVEVEAPRGARRRRRAPGHAGVKRERLLRAVERTQRDVGSAPEQMID